jgi:hypothetical protein
VLDDLEREFHGVAGVSGRLGNLVPPQFTPDHGQGVSEGRPGFAIPGGLPDGGGCRFPPSASDGDIVKLPRLLVDRLTETLCYAA